MKKIILIIILLSIPSFSFGSGLDWLDPTKIGPTLKSLNGNNLSLDNSKLGPPSFNYDGGKVLRDVALWTSLLRLGRYTPYGRLAVPAVLLVEQAYNKGLFDDPFLEPVVRDAFNPPLNGSPAPGIGDIIFHDDKYYQITGSPYSSRAYVEETYLNNYVKLGGSIYYIMSPSLLFYLDYSKKFDRPPTLPPAYLMMYVPFKILSKPPDEVEPSKPIPFDVLQRLIDLLGNILKQQTDQSNQIASKLDNIIANNPYILETPELLTPLEVKDSLTDEKLTDLNDKLNDVNSRLELDPTNSELLKKQADLQKEIEEKSEKINEEKLEEKFDKITVAPWDPYDPGEFDISARFNALINTVKGTALFSFSRDFFESIPSGGSSVVTFEGGETFGNHSVDLSDTLETGLIAFRAVVMVIFGFLAIRAVVMKR